MKRTDFYELTLSKRRTKSLSTSGYSSVPSCSDVSHEKLSSIRVSLARHKVSVNPEPIISGCESVHDFVSALKPSTSCCHLSLTNAAEKLAGESIVHENWVLKKEMRSEIDQSGRKPNKSTCVIINARIFADCSTQTEPDELKENVVVVDDEERVIWSSVETVPFPSVVVHGPKMQQDENMSFEQETTLQESGAVKLEGGKGATVSFSDETRNGNNGLVIAVNSGSTTVENFSNEIRNAKHIFPINSKETGDEARNSSELSVAEKPSTDTNWRESDIEWKKIDREVKYAGIAAAEQIDKILDEAGGDGTPNYSAQPENVEVAMTLPFSYNSCEGSGVRASGQTQITTDQHPTLIPAGNRGDRIKNENYGGPKSLLPRPRTHYEGSYFRSSEGGNSNKSISLSGVDSGSIGGTLNSGISRQKSLENGTSVSEKSIDLSVENRSLDSPVSTLCEKIAEIKGERGEENMSPSLTIVTSDFETAVTCTNFENISEVSIRQGVEPQVPTVQGIPMAESHA